MMPIGISLISRYRIASFDCARGAVSLMGDYRRLSLV